MSTLEDIGFLKPRSPQHLPRLEPKGEQPFHARPAREPATNGTEPRAPADQGQSRPVKKLFPVKNNLSDSKPQTQASSKAVASRTLNEYLIGFHTVSERKSESNQASARRRPRRVR